MIVDLEQSQGAMSLANIQMDTCWRALHIATATVNGAHFLLTWNCHHINNGEILPEVRRICVGLGYDFPVVCTPLELMGTSEP